METTQILEEVTQDMGGIFSPERLILSGEMIVVGLAAVFGVLAILWGVLVIFRKIMYDAPKKREAARMAGLRSNVIESVPAEEAPVFTDLGEPGPEDDSVSDGAIVAAITAAIAAAIASDDALSSQFASGFRVVSFRRRSAPRTGRNR